MGNKAFKLRVPKYFKNFNIENRVSRQIEKIEENTIPHISPRHPSTAQLLKKIEESAPNVNEKEVNQGVVERSKTVTVQSKGGESETGKHETPDKRPKKENEILSWVDDTRKKDIDFTKYGYTKPEKIRSGHLTLRQFDEMLNDYQTSRDPDIVKQFAAGNSIDVNNLNLLIEYFKPLRRIEKNPAEQTENKDNILNEIFPNLRLKDQK